MNLQTDKLVNLISPKIGSKIINFSDDFFGDVSRMLNDKKPIFIEDKYDDNGKWMDGWESRRKRDPGNDWAIIKLGAPGEINIIEIDTSFFTGNFPPFASIEGIYSENKPRNSSNWKKILEKSPLEGNKINTFSVKSSKINYVRLQIYPDGGIARLRLYGKVLFNWEKLKGFENNVELSSLKLGGRIIAYNDAHYGDVSSLITSGRGKDMSDGWETRRRRYPGNDWIIIKLAVPGIIEEIEIDTAHFKGNFPDKASVDVIYNQSTIDSDITNEDIKWENILAPSKLYADKVHRFGQLIKKINSTHVRLNIFPDGGVSRLRVFGKIL